MNISCFTLLDLCVSSLRRGHANLLCIVPILTDDPRRESEWTSPVFFCSARGTHDARCFGTIYAQSLELIVRIAHVLTLSDTCHTIAFSAPSISNIIPVTAYCSSNQIRPAGPIVSLSRVASCHIIVACRSLAARTFWSYDLRICILCIYIYIYI